MLCGGQWRYGAEHTTREEMETVFQYLSRSSSTTKNMISAGFCIIHDIYTFCCSFTQNHGSYRFDDLLFKDFSRTFKEF